MPRGPITRSTPFPTQMGKWGVQGTPLKDLPEKFLKWYATEGQFEDWAEACHRELREREKDGTNETNGSPTPNAIPLQSDHMVVAAALIEENFILVKESLGRETTPDTAQAHTSTLVIALSRSANIDWAVVEEEQRRLHKDLAAKR